MIVPGHFENLSVLHENTLPVRSYFIPASGETEESPWNPLRGTADRLQMLSGCEWMFRYYGSIHDLKDAFFEKDFCPDSTWRPEKVPFCWQMRGYDENQYTNIRYPFPFDPPYVPRQNPCGAYLHQFQWHKDPEAPLTHLVFEGVDSCFYVWVNGIYAGYSQVTHHTAEFDITGLLQEGGNLLAVLVLKWCDGSYLEDQDKFRMSGIIRDVYLLSRPEKHVADYVITTSLSEDLKTAALKICFRFSQGSMPVKLKLFRGGLAGPGFELKTRREMISEKELSGEEETILQVEDPQLWNAETPYLYRLLIETEHEVIVEYVGFRNICVKDGVVLLNGSPIKFRGVNRHESDPVTGACMTMEQVRKDLEMIKAHNFNAVRASHYPNVPYFYQLCDALGLYVIDEADNESHGTAALYYRENDYTRRMQLSHVRIADNPAFIAPTLDRVSSMVLRNRNRPSVLVWSMGNECGYGCTFEIALRWTKKTDPGRLTHYESAFYKASDREYDVSDIDLYGRMYPPFEDVTEYLRNDPEKPLLLVEYCHSMGNSPGDFKEYRDLVEKYPRLCGGFVWEWCDHAVFKGFWENGKPVYWYGGDHGELQHDGNFCLDGLVWPDRKPHTGLLEFKNVHRPFRASYVTGEKSLVIGNFWDFIGAAGLVKANWQMTVDGDLLEEGEFVLPRIAPHTEVSVPLTLHVPDRGRCFLFVKYSLEKPLVGLPKGQELGFDDIRIHTKDERNQKAGALLLVLKGGQGKKPEITQDGTDLIISGSSYTYTLDTLSGLFTSLKAGGQEFLQRPVDFNLWRAPTDNDQPLTELWKGERLDHTVTRAYEVTWEETAGEEADQAVRLRVRQSTAAMSVQPILRTAAEYTIYPNGSILMKAEIEKDPEIETLPRLGLRAFLDPALDTVEYYGIGPFESYVDKCRAGRHGCYASSVADLHEDYIRPQENGSRCGCDYVCLRGDGMAFTVASPDGDTFSFNASVYTQEELENRRHNYELQPCGSTVLCIDHKMSGIGSKSCGPDLAKQYRIDADTYRFTYLIRPEKV
ncbi:MAG: beta-galactosidase [Stomatobaculum sp.]|nr:beta-galactosidase [Stomatobaculum sp.]